MEHRHSHGQRHDGRPRGKGYRVAFLLAFSVALLAEMLLFMNAQMREVAAILKEDFRVIVVRDERARETPEAVEALLRAVPGTDRVFFVSRKERLARLKAEEPDLVASVLTPGTNPMPDTWEVLVKEETLGDMGAWAALAWRVPGVADVKYKPLEAYAVMHALFYGHLTRLALAISFLALMIMAAAVLSRRPASSLASSLPQARGWLLAGAAGAGAAVLAAYAAVYPVKYLSPVWIWPNPLWQAGVAACGAVLGWVLCEWKADQQG
jgi:hypothetical protein